MSEPGPNADETTSVTTRPAPEVVREASLVRREQPSGVRVALVSGAAGTGGAAATTLTLHALGLAGAAFWGVFITTMLVTVAIVYVVLRRPRD